MVAVVVCRRCCHRLALLVIAWLKQKKLPLSTDSMNITTQNPTITALDDTNRTQPYENEPSDVDYLLYGFSVVPLFVMVVCYICYRCVFLKPNSRGNNSGAADDGVVSHGSLASGIASSRLTSHATFSSSGLSPPDSSSMLFGSMTYTNTNFLPNFAQYSSDSSYSNFAKI